MENSCHCGKPGSACMWCLKDHPSGNSVMTYRCDDHTFDHSQAHMLKPLTERMELIKADARLSGLEVPES